jgi:hypothetical protein
MALGQLFQNKTEHSVISSKGGRLDFQDQSSLAKHSGAAEEVWYHGYHAS